MGKILNHRVKILLLINNCIISKLHAILSTFITVLNYKNILVRNISNTTYVYKYLRNIANPTHYICLAYKSRQLIKHNSVTIQLSIFGFDNLPVIQLYHTLTEL